MSISIGETPVYEVSDTSLLIHKASSNLMRIQTNQLDNEFQIGDFKLGFRSIMGQTNFELMHLNESLVRFLSNEIFFEKPVLFVSNVTMNFPLINKNFNINLLETSNLEVISTTGIPFVVQDTNGTSVLEVQMNKQAFFHGNIGIGIETPSFALETTMAHITENLYGDRIQTSNIFLNEIRGRSSPDSYISFDNKTIKVIANSTILENPRLAGDIKYEGTISLQKSSIGTLITSNVQIINNKPTEPALLIKQLASPIDIDTNVGGPLHINSYISYIDTIIPVFTIDAHGRISSGRNTISSIQPDAAYSYTIDAIRYPYISRFLNLTSCNTSYQTIVDKKGHIGIGTDDSISHRIHISLSNETAFPPSIIGLYQTTCNLKPYLICYNCNEEIRFMIDTNGAIRFKENAIYDHTYGLEITSNAYISYLETDRFISDNHTYNWNQYTFSNLKCIHTSYLDVLQQGTLSNVYISNVVVDDIEWNALQYTKNPVLVYIPAMRWLLMSCNFVMHPNSNFFESENPSLVNDSIRIYTNGTIDDDVNAIHIIANNKTSTISIVNQNTAVSGVAQFELNANQNRYQFGMVTLSENTYEGYISCNINPMDPNRELTFTTDGLRIGEKNHILKTGKMTLNQSTPGTQSLNVLGDMEWISDTTSNTSFIITKEGNIGIGTTLPQTNLDIYASNMYLSGNLGIGTYFPRYQLDIIGTLRGSNILGVQTNDIIGSFNPWIPTHSNLYSRYLNGNIGIGTTNPTASLEIYTNQSNASFLTINTTKPYELHWPSTPLVLTSTTQSNISSLEPISVLYNSNLRIPPNELSANSTQITNELYGNGTYTIEYSTQNTSSFWMPYLINTTQNWKGVCWAEELGLYVAVSDSGTNNQVITSTDGIHWTSRTTPVNNSWQSICWAPQIPLFVAVASSGTANRVMTSPNGITWTSRTSPDNYNWTSVCWSPELSRFVAVGVLPSGASGIAGGVMTSENGITWTGRTWPGSGARSVCWASGLSKFVAVAYTRSTVSSALGHDVNISTDGISWTQIVPSTGSLWTAVCWSPELSLLVAAGSIDTYYPTSYLMYSSTGTSWTVISSPLSGNWSSIAWSSKRQQFIIAPLQWRENVIVSTNGTTWSVGDTVSSRWNSITWAPSLEQFVMAGTNGTNGWIAVNHYNTLAYKGFTSNQLWTGTSRYTYYSAPGITYEASLNGYYGDSIRIITPEPFILQKYTVTAPRLSDRFKTTPVTDPATYKLAPPKNWVILGATSSTGPWTVLQEAVNSSITANGYSITCNLINNTTAYNVYALVATEVPESTITSKVAIQQWILYEASNTRSIAVGSRSNYSVVMSASNTIQTNDATYHTGTYLVNVSPSNYVTSYSYTNVNFNHSYPLKIISTPNSILELSDPTQLLNSNASFSFSTRSNIFTNTTDVSVPLQIQIQYPSFNIPIESYSIKASNNPNLAPNKWNVYHSNISFVDWQLIDQQTDVQWNVNEIKTFILSTPSSNNFYRYDFYRNNDPIPSTLEITNIIANNVTYSESIKLVDIYSYDSNQYQIKLNGSLVIGSNSMIQSYQSTTSALIIDGSLGIGTTSPTSSLHVQGNMYVTGNMINEGPLYIGQNNCGHIYLGGANKYDHTVIETRLYNTNSTELLLFKGSNASTDINGPDRIRVRSSRIDLDVYTDTSDNYKTSNIRASINSNGVSGISSVTSSNIQYESLIATNNVYMLKQNIYNLPGSTIITHPTSFKYGYARIQMWGAGGGGAGADYEGVINNGNGSTIPGGGAGGAGAYGEITLPWHVLANSTLVANIGYGGIGGLGGYIASSTLVNTTKVSSTAGVGQAATNGTNGTATSLSLSISGANASLSANWYANGGIGGSVGIGTQGGIGGSGATTSGIFDVSQSGTSGGNGGSAISILPTTNGTIGAFILKYNSEGICTGSAPIVGTNDTNGYSVCTDSTGNVYMIGKYESTSTITLKNLDGTNSARTLAASTVVDAYIVKYSSAGICTGSVRIPGSGTDNGFSICTDVNNNLYATGIYYSSTSVSITNLDGTSSGKTLPISTSTFADVFILKFNSSGTCTHAISIKALSYSYAWSITTDANANMYIGGSYSTSSQITVLNLDGTNSTKTLPINDDGPFIIRYTSANVCSQAISMFSGSGALLTGTIYSMKADSFGNLYVVGYYNNNQTTKILNLDGTTSARTLPFTTSDELFIIKYSTITNMCTAAITLNSDPFSTAYSVCTDTNGNVYVTGEYLSSVSITVPNLDGTSSSKNLVATANRNTFILKYQPNGTCVSAISIYTNLNNNIGYSIYTDVNNNLYVTGNYQSTTAINILNLDGSTSGQSLPSSAGTDPYIIKYDSNGICQSAVSLRGQHFYSDNALSVTGDSNQNIYVCGQINIASTTNLSVPYYNYAIIYNLNNERITNANGVRGTNLSGVGFAASGGGGGASVPTNIVIPATLIYGAGNSGSGCIPYAYLSGTPAKACGELVNNTFTSIIKTNEAGYTINDTYGGGTGGGGSASYSANISAGNTSPATVNRAKDGGWPGGGGGGGGAAKQVFPNIGYYGYGASVTAGYGGNGGNGAIIITYY